MYERKYHQGNLEELSFLVTGGAGFIGSNIVEYLIKNGAKNVRVLDNFSTGYKVNLNNYINYKGFELLEGDICDYNTCANAVEGIDYVTHQAALGSVPRSISDPITSNNVNVSGFLNMLVAARNAKVKRFVYAASSSTYGDHPALPKTEENIGNPISPYAITKYVNELYAEVFSKTYEFHTLGLRYFNIFGPRQNPKGPYAAVIPLFIQSALQNEPAIINGDGETSRDFTFIENAVQANIKAFFSIIEKHEVMNIAYGERTTLNQLHQLINELSGDSTQPEYRPERKGDVKHSLADITKAKTVIGYQPTVSLKEGLALTMETYMAEQTEK